MIEFETTKEGDHFLKTTLYGGCVFNFGRLDDPVFENLKWSKNASAYTVYRNIIYADGFMIKFPSKIATLIHMGKEVVRTYNSNGVYVCEDLIESLKTTIRKNGRVQYFEVPTLQPSGVYDYAGIYCIPYKTFSGRVLDWDAVKRVAIFCSKRRLRRNSELVVSRLLGELTTKLV